MLTESGGANKRFFCDIGTFFLYFLICQIVAHERVQEKKKKVRLNIAMDLIMTLWAIINEFNC